MTPKELKQRIDLEDFIIANGYYPKREKWTHKWPVYTNGNETILIIPPGEKGYKTFKQTNGDSGSIIDFCKNRSELVRGYTGTPVQQAYRMLLDYYHKTCGIPIESSSKSVPPALVFNPNLYSKCESKEDKIFDYLKSRGISNRTLISRVFENIGIYTYEDRFHNKHRNIGFPLFNMNNDLVGIEQHNFGYKKMAGGSDKTNGVWLSNNLSVVNEIIIGEAVIDLLSYHELFNPNKTDVLYISTCGNMTMNQLKNIFSIINRSNHNLKVTTVFDNDKDGNMYTNKVLLSLLEYKVIFPRSYQKKFQIYTPLTSFRLKSAICNEPDFQIADLDNYFELILPFNDSVVRKLNRILTKCIDIVNVDIACPKLKDFNEDLQSQRNIIPKNKKSSPKNKSHNFLTTDIMAKIPKEKFPTDILRKLGFNVEKLLSNETFCNALAYSERLGPYNISVTDIFGKKQSVPAKIRLVMHGEDPKVLVEYASAYLDLKKKFWDYSFNEAQQKFLLRYREAGEPIELTFNGKKIKGLVGIDDQLNILHFTPLSRVRIFDHYLSQEIEDKESIILKSGGMIYKENLIHPQSGEYFNSVLYWSSTKEKLGFHTPTPDLLELCRKYDERLNQSLIQTNISQHIEMNPTTDLSPEQTQSMNLPF